MAPSEQIGWTLLFVLPDANVSQSVEAEFLALVPHSDTRLTAIAQASPSDQALLRNFTDIFGEPIRPSAIIAPADAPSRVLAAQAVVAFRNCVALSCICATYAFGSAPFFGPQYSDHFDLYPVKVGKKRELLRFTPAVGQFGHEESFKHFRGQSASSLGELQPFDPKEDSLLLKLLLRRWRERFVHQRADWPLERLFRSLEIPYQSAGMPFKNQAALQDAGTLAALWVSAFETLLHPGGEHGRANLNLVVDLLDQVDYGLGEASSLRSPERRLVLREYEMKRGKKEERQVRLLPELYRQLYEARCPFIHGNPVAREKLFAFGREDRPLLLDLAPLIYRFAILQSYQPGWAASVTGFLDDRVGAEAGEILLKAAGHDPEVDDAEAPNTSLGPGP